MTGARKSIWRGAPGGSARSWVGFAGAACSLVAVFAASASPIPLYELYRRTDGLSHADLSLTAVAYFVAVMAALVVLGRLSNHVGRRPVALAALVVTAVGTLVLTEVHILLSLHAGAVVPFVIASAVAGAAQGTTFAGSMRALLTQATAAERAGVLSAIYLISYGGAAVPGLIAGQLSRSLSLFDIALGYGVLAGLACAFTLVAARERRPTSPAERPATA